MKPSWDHDSLDAVLRKVMQAQPEPAPIQGLARRAVQRARSRAAVRRRESPARGVSFAGWHLAITLSTALVVGLLGWFASSHVSLLGDYAFSSSAVPDDDVAQTGSEIGLADSEALMPASIGCVLLAMVGVAVVRAFACDEGFLLDSKRSPPL